MKIYVAGKFEDYKKVQAVQSIARSYGHSITYDWTENAVDILVKGNPRTEEFEAQCAEMDIWGVKQCHLLIALYHPRALGTVAEAGMAIVLGKQVWIVGPWQHSVFWLVPGVQRLQVEDTETTDWFEATLPSLNRMLREKSPTA